MERRQEEDAKREIMEEKREEWKRGEYLVDKTLFSFGVSERPVSVHARETYPHQIYMAFRTQTPSCVSNYSLYEAPHYPPYAVSRSLYYESHSVALFLHSLNLSLIHSLTLEDLGQSHQTLKSPLCTFLASVMRNLALCVCVCLGWGKGNSG